MQKNVGGYDRIARLVVGPLLVVVGAAAIAGLFSVASGTLGLVLAALAIVVGGVFVATGITQKCPINNALGVNTYRAKPEAEEPETADQTAGRPS
jgi:hypothetical protein